MSNKINNSDSPGKPPFWNDPAVRSIFFQTLLLIGVFGFLYYIASNTLDNMAKRGISTGFAFLDYKAGFGILMSLIDFTESDSYGKTFFVGLLNTLLVSGIGIVFATIMGFIIGVTRLSKNWLLARIAAVYIETFRNIPLLLQILFWYFAVLRSLPSPRQSWSFFDSFFLNVRGLYIPKPVFESGFSLTLIFLAIGIIGAIFVKKWARKRLDATGQPFPVFYTSLGLILGLPVLAFLVTGAPLTWEMPALTGFNFTGGLPIIPELMALGLSLTIYTAAFIAEIVRAGILSVSHGQTEAAHALGLKTGPTLQLVIIPQALRVIIPPLTSQYLNLTKNSSLATAVGYPDLVAVWAGTTLNQTGQAVEIILTTMAVYLTISLSISFVMNIYNKRVALIER